MPSINLFKCNKCDFSLPSGWGGHTYVKDNHGNKVICSHPGEYADVAKVLGIEASSIFAFPYSPWPPSDPHIAELLKQRTGFYSHCICLKCLNQFDLDIEKDERKCPECKSSEVKSELEMIGQQCPRCNIGNMEMIETGWVS